MKNIYQIAENVSFESGGLRTVLVNLDNYLNNETNYNSVIVSNYMEKKDNYIGFEPKNFKFWSYSSGMNKYLNQKKNDINLSHIHGVFLYAQYISSKISIENNIPYIVSPHGMLEPWHLKDKNLKKEIYLKLFLNNILKKSNVIHAITPLEKDNLFKLTKHKNIVEISNFILLDSLPKFSTSNYEDEDYLLFLGRLHPKKGIDLIIDAMTKIVDKKIKLKIVGSENTYSEDLKKRCYSLGLSNRVEFLGSVFGEEKYNLFSNAKAFLSPSYSEAIGMVNLEAAACNTPVLTTFNTGLMPEWNSNGGILINPKVNELISKINEITSWSKSERDERGKSLSNFVLTNYSWEKKGYLWNELYNSIL